MSAVLAGFSAGSVFADTAHFALLKAVGSHDGAAGTSAPLVPHVAEEVSTGAAAAATDPALATAIAAPVPQADTLTVAPDDRPRVANEP